MNVCKNCNYHDDSDTVPEKCPACYFRHDSALTHKAPEPVVEKPVAEAAGEEVKTEEDAKIEPKAEIKAEMVAAEALEDGKASEDGKAVEETL